MKRLIYLFVFIASLSVFNSCVDNTIDEPPVKDTPIIETNATVADVTSKWVSGQFVEITDDLVFDAVVVADDESGNFYKNVVIQDETGGLTVRIEANNLYTILPVGRKVYIRAQGLTLSDYNGLVQLGFGEEDGNLLTIPFPLVSDDIETGVIIPGERDQLVTPTTVEINTLGNAALNTLIELDEVQFADGELGQTYADAENQFSENRTLVDCDGNEIVVRTSGFSSFAGTTIAEGKGSMLAIYSIFGDTKQLLIRDLEDLTLTSERCGEVVVNLPTPNATIADLMALYSEGSVTAITSDIVFDAVVVADDASGNFYKQIVVQDETGGINIQINAFDLFEDFPVGRDVVVKAQGLAIGDFNGLPQIGVDNGDQVGRIPETTYKDIVFRGALSTVDYKETVDITELDDSYYNELIQLDGVEFIGGSLGSTYADAVNMFAINHDIVDCDGNTITLRTSGFADFADFQVAEGNGSLTAIMSVYQGTKQLIIRKIQDVNMNGTRCDGGGGGGNAVDELMMDFEGLAIGVDVNITDWENEVVQGTRKWRTKEFDNNIYVQATAFQDEEPSMETWLVTPAISMNGNNKLSFRSAVAFYTHNGLKIMISSNYNGDANAASWTELNANLAGSSQSNYEWVNSGEIDLSSYSGEVHIGFQYVGDGASNTCTYIIDDISVTK